MSPLLLYPNNIFGRYLPQIFQSFLVLHVTVTEWLLGFEKLFRHILNFMIVDHIDT